MKTPVDFKKERLKRQRTRRFKQIMIFLAIILAIFVALFINDLMVKKNATLRIGDILGAAGGDGFPSEIPSGSVKDIKSIGSNLVILKESNMYVYSKKGKQTDNVQQMNEKTVIATNQDRILVYDIGGREASLYSSTTHLHTFEFENNIITADIGDSGQVAIVTSPPNFVAEISVYTPKNNVFYTRTFSEKLVSNVSLSTKGKSMAVATLGTRTGVLESEIIFYNLASEEEAATITISDRMVIWMDYIDEETLAILTNGTYFLYDNSGALLSSYTFPENFVLQEYRTHKGNFLLLGKDSDTREHVLTLISSKGAELASTRDERRPLDIAFNDKSTYVLSSDGISEYNNAFVLQKEYYYQGVERIYVIDDRVYLITKNEIHILEKE